MYKITKNKKIAIILYNLGGPNNYKETRSFLNNLFYDVLLIPNPFRWILSRIISLFRLKKAKEAYHHLEYKSPIIEETILQQNKLQKLLDQNNNIKYKVFIAMQCSNPTFQSTYVDIVNYNPDKIITIPLYPQYCEVTTGASINRINKIFKKNNNLTNICCYYNNNNFIKAHVELIKLHSNIHNKNRKDYRILFSAHGVPNFLIDKGDPYEFQVQETVKLIVDKLKLSDLDWKLTYQSKVGRMKWLEPSTEKEILLAAKNKKNIIIVPISFVSEHLETLVELDIEYYEIVKNYNIDYIRVPTLRNNITYINGLKELINNIDLKNNICSNHCKRNCPKSFKLCKHD